MKSRTFCIALVIQKDLHTADDIKIIVILYQSDRSESDFFFFCLSVLLCVFFFSEHVFVCLCVCARSIASDSEYLLLS